MEPDPVQPPTGRPGSGLMETWRGRRVVVGVVVVVMALTAAGVAAISGAHTDPVATALDDGEVRTASVTVDDGGTVEIGPRLSVVIPPGAVSENGSVQIRRDDSAAPPRDVALIPDGPSYEIELTGARLSGVATIKLPVSPSSDGSPVLAGYWDTDAGRWQVLSAAHQPGADVLSFTTDHLSRFGIFRIDTTWLAGLFRGGLAGAFSTDLFGATAPRCDNEAEARSRATVAAHTVRGANSSAVLWCLDQDEEDRTVLRTVNNRRFGLSVQGLTGLDRVDTTASTLPTLKALGPALEKRYGYRTDDVVAKGGGATFALSPGVTKGGLRFENSGMTVAVDVLDLGVDLYLTVNGKLGGRSKSEQLLELGDKASCLVEAVNELAPPSLAAGALGKAVSSSLRQIAECFGDVWHLGEDLPNPVKAAAVAALLSILRSTVDAVVAQGQFWSDFVAGAHQYFFTVTAVGPADPPGPDVAPSPPEGGTTGPTSPAPIPETFGSSRDTEHPTIALPMNEAGTETQMFRCGDTVHFTAFVKNPTAFPIRAEGVFHTRAEDDQVGTEKSQELTIQPGATATFQSQYRIRDSTPSLYSFQFTFYVRNGKGSSGTAFHAMC